MTENSPPSRPLSILLTGGTGFVGRFLAAELRRRGHRIVFVTRPGTRESPDVETVHLDLARPVDPNHIPPADVVVHLAQSAHYRDFTKNAADIIQVNTAATFALAEGARRMGARSFVLASTGSVYGDSAATREDAALAAGSVYAASKLAAETLLVPYRDYLSVCVLRLFAPYGPSQSSRLVPTLIERVRTGSPITLDGEADGLRFSAIYAKDLAELMAEAVERRWEGTFNVAAPAGTSIRQVASCAGRLLGREVCFERSGRAEPAALVPELGRLAGVYDISRLRPIEEGLADMLSGA